MAQYTTYYFPDDSAFVPSDEAATQAISMLKEALVYYPVTLHRYPAPSFISSGCDFEKFTCPSCKRLVRQSKLDDAGKDWWYMVLWSLRSEDQVIKVPCCGAELALKEFDFGNDVGFASFALEVEGLGEDEQPGDDPRAALGSILGCRVRRIIDVDA